MKIDLFSHVCPQKFMDAFANTTRRLTWDEISGDARIQGGAVLWDMEKRIEIMDRYEDYFQVLIPVAEVVEPFFGPEHIVFGTDFPMDQSLGDQFIKKTIDAVHRMKISDGDKELIFSGNAKRILRLRI